MQAVPPEVARHDTPPKNSGHVGHGRHFVSFDGSLNERTGNLKDRILYRWMHQTIRGVGFHNVDSLQMQEGFFWGENKV